MTACMMKVRESDRSTRIYAGLNLAEHRTWLSALCLHLCYSGALCYAYLHPFTCSPFLQAWNNVNLTRIAEKIKSPLVLYIASFPRAFDQLIAHFHAADMCEQRLRVLCLWTIATHLYMGNSWCAQRMYDGGCAYTMYTVHAQWRD